MNEKRRKIWIDPFQTQLLIHIALYFLFFQALAGLTFVFGWHIVQGLGYLRPEMDSAAFLVPTVIFLSFFALLFIYDAMKFAHRVVGPIYRFRKIVRSITAGEDPELVQLRHGDFLLEFRDEFNAMLRVLEQRGALTIQTPKAKQDQKQEVPV